MTPAQRLQVEQSTRRQRLSELATVEELTDDNRSEIDRLTRAYQDGERQLRAALLAEDVEAERHELTDPEPDRLELRRRCTVTGFLLAALAGRSPVGAEAELAEEIGAGPGQIPIELFDVPETRDAAAGRETRQDVATTAPASGTGVNLDPIRPRIYARSVLPRLGVAMPRVKTGGYSTATVTAGLSAGAMDAGAARVSTAATLTAQSTTPHRVSARLSIRVEDVATIGAANFEAVLRQNLTLAMSDELDRLGLNGDGAGANPLGLLAQLTDPAAPSDVIDWNAWVRLVAGGIDGGPWAETLQAVTLLVNAESQRLAETTFKDGSGFGGEMSAAAYLRANSGGFFSSRRMPATASDIAQAIRYRRGTAGLGGVDAVRAAVCPVWSVISIDDIYSDSASGTRHFTLHHLIGDVLIEQPDAFEQVAARLA